MAITDFIQADKITALATELVKERSVYASVMGVKNDTGSSIQIPVYAGGTLRDYVGGQLTIDPAASSKITIDLDQKKYINNLLDAVETYNSAQSILPQVLNDMTNLVSAAQDTYAMERIHTLAGITTADLGVGGTPVAVTTEAEMKEYLKTIRVQMLKNNINLEDSFIVFPPELEALAVELKAFSPATSINGEALAKGLLGQLYGMMIYTSNHLPLINAGERGIVAGSRLASNMILNYNKFKNGDGGIEYEGEYYRVVASYGAGANNPALLMRGVVTEA